MGVGRGVEDNAVKDAVGGLDLVHQGALVVALAHRGRDAQAGGGVLDHQNQVGVALAAVDGGLPEPQKVEVWPVENEKIHGIAPFMGVEVRFRRGL